MKIINAVLVRRICIPLLALLVNSPAHSQQYPAKPVRIIVPAAPGGGTDLIGRVLGQKLAKVFGQPFVVDNKGGAGTTLGTELAAKSPSDGYTLVLEHVSLAFNASYYKHLPYDAVRDFAPIMLVANQPYFVVVHPSLPAKSINDLLALARTRPGAIAYASGGAGSGPFMGAELMKHMTGIDLLHVPYRGAGLAFTDVISGQVPVMFATVSLALPHVRAGRVRALATSGARRSASMPELPTIAESGVRGFDFSTWYGLLAPAGTPRPLISRLHDETARILDEAETRERFAGDGIEPLKSSPDEFAAFLARDIARWAKVVNATRLHAD
ncbi:MAG: tripartite tricarboxylate transporter substrate binding protein [Burkholderiales bacterium]